VADQLDDLELRAWRGFLSLHSRLVRDLDQELADEASLRLNQYEVLLRLKQAPDEAMRMSELAAKVYLSPSGVSRAVDQLERRGLVERRICASDRRGYLAVLTEKGRARLRAAANIHVRGIKDHFTSKMSRDELNELAGLLETIG
jgi:DNA-binding MarR family transcriptional regulator